MQRRRVVLQSPRLLEKKRKYNRIKYSVIFGALLFLFTGFYFLVRQPFLNIQNLKIEGAEVIDTKEVETKVKEFLSSTYLHILPKSNIFFYPKKTIESNLKILFPRIDNLSFNIEKNLLEILIKEKSAFALWCRDECYFLDSVGNVFAYAPIFEGGVYKAFSGIIQGEPLGQQFLNEKEISNIRKIYESIENFGISILKIKVISLKEIYLESSSGGEFLIDLTKKTEETIENIQAVLSSEEFKGYLPELSGVDYIDLRFGSKIFFKKTSPEEKSP